MPLPEIKSPAVRAFLDALEVLHRCRLRSLVEQSDEMLTPKGRRLKRTYLALCTAPVRTAVNNEDALKVFTATGFTPHATIEDMISTSDLNDIDLAEALVFDAQEAGDAHVTVTVTVEIKPTPSK